jgi:hypothetical protein
MKEETLPKKAFMQHRGERLNGFRLTFPNGNSISTVWSNSTYSDNYDNGYFTEEGKIDETKINCPLSSNTVEAMVDCPELMLDLLKEKFNGDNPFGYLTITQWLEMLNILAKDYK